MGVEIEIIERFGIFWWQIYFIMITMSYTVIVDTLPQLMMQMMSSLYKIEDQRIQSGAIRLDQTYGRILIDDHIL